MNNHRTNHTSDNLGGSISRQERPRPKRWRGVFLEGPEPQLDRDGEEIPVWFVYVGDEEGIDVGKVYKNHDFQAALALALRMAVDRKLELINEATPA